MLDLEMCGISQAFRAKCRIIPDNGFQQGVCFRSTWIAHLADTADAGAAFRLIEQPSSTAPIIIRNVVAPAISCRVATPWTFNKKQGKERFSWPQPNPAKKTATGHGWWLM
ncbi:MAG: hypothetical protein Q4B13_02495 [Lautropia sp.]|nr:hypothetical protein [Lautropia sp.]